VSKHKKSKQTREAARWADRQQAPGKPPEPLTFSGNPPAGYRCTRCGTQLAGPHEQDEHNHAAHLQRRDQQEAG